MSETDVEFVFLISTLGRVRGETVVVSEPDQIRFLDSFQYAYRTKAVKVDKVDDKSVEPVEPAEPAEPAVEVIDEPAVEVVEAVEPIDEAASDDPVEYPRKKRAS